MYRFRKLLILLILVAIPGLPQRESEPDDFHSPPPVRLPNGKLQRDEILKAEHKKALADCDRLLKMAEDLKIELERNSSHVLSLGAIRKTEEIEKLARRIRGRMQPQ
jgi:hypothetical protein